MNLRHRPTSDEAAMSPDHVLLEQWATFSGRQLALRVSTDDAASPDVVTVHVRYGGGQAEVVVRADEQASSEASSSTSEVDQTPDQVPRATTERNETELRSPCEEEETEPAAANTLGRFTGSKIEETSSSASGEQQCTSTAVNNNVGAVNSDVGRDGMSCRLSSEEQQDPEPSNGTLENTVKPIVGCPQNGPTTSGQVKANQDAGNATSQPHNTVEDTPITRQTELRIGRFDLPAVLDDKELTRLLQERPNLRCLSIDWRLDGRKLNIDIVSRYCQNLVELDLTRFRLDTWSLEQLCRACPKLEVVKMPRKCDESYVEVLLRNLPRLRSLDLAHTSATGQFLERPPDSLERLSLAGCKSLKYGLGGQGHPSWEKVRELDLSFTQVTPAALAEILSHFPRLERLSLAHCGKFESTSLLQVALCENLRGLDVSHVGSLQASDLLAVLIRCPQLERLTVAGCTVRESSCLRQLDQGKAALRLRELDVSNVKELATVDLTAILTRSPQLERLLAAQLDGMDLTACLTQLGRCAELRELDVSRSGTLRNVPRNEPDTKPKQVFSFGASAQQGERQSSSLFGGQTTFGGTAPSAGFSFGGFGAPAQSTTLGFTAAQLQGHLVLHNQSEPRGSRCPISTAGRSSPAVLTSLLSGCQKLERLLLAGCYVPESASLRQLAQCSVLRELDLSRVTTLKTAHQALGRGSCQSVDAADLAEALSGCPLLERLSVAGLKAPVEQLVPPTGLPKLTYLDASRTGLTNNSLRRLPGLFPELHTLNIQECPLVREDGLVSYLPCLKQLRCLDLRDVSAVSDELMETLKECQLTKLRLSCRRDPAGKKLIGLALDCPSLKMLGLESSEGCLNDFEDLIKQRLAAHRVFVLCFKDRQVTRNPPERYPQPGPLFILNDDTVSWEKTDVTSV